MTTIQTIYMLIGVLSVAVIVLAAGGVAVLVHMQPKLVQPLTLAAVVAFGLVTVVLTIVGWAK
ncbi:hypothetical protein [Streptomyces sp. NPDC051909]|uniref:hypothetical protein n=1 Tax=Streptomyces sp. NPDC051909 TaxID=3154944 RepID=UPI003432B77C